MSDETVEQEETKKKGALRGVAIRYLRGLGHHLEPVVLIGKDGVTDALAAAAKSAILRHELIKVKVLAEAPIDRHTAAADLAAASGAELVQVLGRTFLLYKRHPNKPRITLPKTRKDATTQATEAPKKKKKNRRRAKKGA